MLTSLLSVYSANNDDDRFDLIQPTLIQQLRKILDEYRDDGQILKVRLIKVAICSYIHSQMFGFIIN